MTRALPFLLFAMSATACVDRHRSPSETPDPYATRAYESQDFDAENYGSTPTTGPGYTESPGHYGHGSPEEHKPAEPAGRARHRPASPSRR